VTETEIVISRVLHVQQGATGEMEP
jgi:hypothetical protein